jgi:serine O-acetyltransferase
MYYFLLGENRNKSEENLMKAINIYRIGHFFYNKNMRRISKVFDYINLLLFNSYIPSSCKIGKDTLIAYGGIGVVIHSRAIIGDHCMIGQGITIGGRNGETDVPTIEDNVYLGAGCRIIGDIKVGHDSIVAPNSVVTKSFAPYSVLAGVPAKVINEITKENIDKYKKNYGPISYKNIE